MNERELTPGHQVKDKKLMMRIWINKEGQIAIESAFKAKEFAVRLLTDSLEQAKSVEGSMIELTQEQLIEKLKKENVTPGQLQQQIKKFFRPKPNNRTKSHKRHN